MQKARGHPGGLPPLVSTRFQNSFTPEFGLFSSFSRLTGSLSVVKECSALESGLPMFSPGFPSPNLLEGIASVRLQGFHLLWRGIPSASLALLVYPISLAATLGVAVAFLSCEY